MCVCVCVVRAEWMHIFFIIDCRGCLQRQRGMTSPFAFCMHAWWNTCTGCHRCEAHDSLHEIFFSFLMRRGTPRTLGKRRTHYFLSMQISNSIYLTGQLSWHSEDWLPIAYSKVDLTKAQGERNTRTLLTAQGHLSIIGCFRNPLEWSINKEAKRQSKPRSGLAITHVAKPL